MVSRSLTSIEQVSSVKKEVKRVLLGQLNALADDVVEMARGKVIRDEVPKKGRVRLIFSDSDRTGMYE
jgi:putative aminopeptidase FrvX